MAKSSGGPSVESAPGRLQLNLIDAALVFVIANSLRECPVATRHRLIEQEFAPVGLANNFEIRDEFTAVRGATANSLFVNVPGNILQICCRLDDSSTIPMWLSRVALPMRFEPDSPVLMI
jgi:hypothetical protein